MAFAKNEEAAKLSLHLPRTDLGILTSPVVARRVQN